MKPAPSLPLPRRKPRLCLGATSLVELGLVVALAAREGRVLDQLAALYELRRRREEVTIEVAS
jgi:hypothetical protein